MTPDPAESNRALLLTPPGAAAIAVIRLLGPGVPAFLQRHFSRPAKPHRCVHGNLTDAAGQVIDDPVVVLHDRGADLSLHGGPWIVRSVLDFLAREGFNVLPNSSSAPLPLEATDAADTIPAEIEAWLPLARTELATRLLLAQEEAWRDFETAPDADAARRVLNDLSLWRLLHPPRVAIVGPANVGKSTLANHLFAQERSIVADLPGTTRDWVGELADISGLPVLLVDTPGLRPTSDPIEHTAIQRSTAEIARADLVLLVLDQSRPLPGEQADLLSAYPDAVVVLNKSDQPPAEGMSTLPGLHTTASTGQGLDALRTAITRHFECDNLDPTPPRWWTPRQRAWLANHLADEG